MNEVKYPAYIGLLNLLENALNFTLIPSTPRVVQRITQVVCRLGSTVALALNIRLLGRKHHSILLIDVKISFTVGAKSVGTESPA